MKLKGLQVKITVPVLILTSLVLSFYAFYSYNKREKQLYSEFNKLIKETKSRLSSNLPRLIYRENSEAIQQIVETDMRLKEIHGIVVLDEDRKEITFGIYKDSKGKFIKSKDFSILDQNKKRAIDELIYKDDFYKEKELVGWYIFFTNDEFIKKQLEEELYSIILTIFLLDLFIVLIISILINKLIIHPLQDISEVSKNVSEKNFSKRVHQKYIVRSKDEISLLSKSINNMTDRMQILTTSLKNEVDAQTKEIKIQNTSFINLLSNLDQGFIVIDFKGEVINDPTSKTTEILDTNPKYKNITDLFQLNNTEKVSFLKWLSHVQKGNIPFKDLIPLNISRLENFRGRVINLDYKPIFSGKGNGKIDKVICILNDITKEINAQKKIIFAQEKSDMILRLVEFPLEFLDIFSEIQEVIELFKKNSYHNKFEDLFRQLHTLKARFASFKISLIVDRIHSIESDLFIVMNKKNEKNFKNFREGEKKANLALTKDNKDLEMKNVHESIKFKIYNLETFIKEYIKENRKVIELAQSSLSSGESYDNLQKAKEELLKFYDSIALNFITKNIKDAFRPFKATVEQVSESQGKKVRFEIEETDININYEPYKDFFKSLHHVFRNAIDHGIEEKDKRIDQNKSEEAFIKVLFKRKGLYRFQIGIRDDGAGIDHNKIKDKVRKNLEEMETDGVDDYIENMSTDQAIQLIFEPGFTTKSETSTLSGRGVGMDAVKKAVEDLEGKVWVESEIGEGTLFVAELPILMR